MTLHKKDKALGQELRFGSDRALEAAFSLIGAVKTICVCVCDKGGRKVLCDTKSYPKCENASRINVRPLYVWGELIFTLESFSVPHGEDKNTELTALDDYLCELAWVLVQTR